MSGFGGFGRLDLGLGRRGGGAGGVPSFDGGDLVAATVLAAAERMATGGDTDGPAAGGTLTINGVALSSYDYAIHEGDLTVTDAIAMSQYFTATEDIRSAWLIVKGNLTVNAGATLRPGVRKLFSVVYATGNITVNGTISMTARGANHSGTGNSGFGSAFDPSGPILIAAGDYYDGVGTVSNPAVPVAGGAGAGAVTTANNNGGTGTAGTGGGTGGGGSGRYQGAGIVIGSGAGAAGSAFAGGSAGGGINAGQNDAGASAGHAVARGGAGGIAAIVGTDTGAAGGGGNPGGASVDSGGTIAATANGQSGCAGTLFLICDQLAGSGELRSVGPNAGTTNPIRGNGGSGGGGHVTVVCNADNSSVALSAAGGAIQGTTGGPGALGTARILEAV